MGVVNLLSTGDYWSSYSCMPQHSMMTELEEKEGDDEENISEEEYATDELYVECVVRDEEDEYKSDEED
eukprot:5894467-Ditylum_brightwellii.AAC.1